ncbi:UDP-forming cellulose synthase catalytic subunit [Falsiroseomonas sp. HC035]|uniref:UDP-forming cellulose synthase catalytic subunit n=1 Tax=Falsiroseomonas sp. HC035 TaxID=3390999 RepID=UPI003D31A9F5
MIRAATEGRLPLPGRLLRGLLVGLGLLALVIVVTVPLPGEAQGVLTLAGAAAFIVLNRFRSRRVTVVLVMLSVAITSRYLFWRVTQTLEFETFLGGTLSIGLLLAETYAATLLFLSYVQLTWPLDRKPVPLPPDPSLWPTVDIYVPSYNEDLDIVRPTVLAAMNIDWPRDRMNVYILDDGRRPAFRDFAEQVGCGYIIRPDNKGAKAGNINHALKHTDGEYIAIFDCDHAPTRAFLQLTAGWLVRDARIAMVQTPHFFYSADPFERNLARRRPVPNEGLLFYGAIQPGNDLWNAAFFCGSCALIRRTALEEVGGVPHQTVTEDCHCSFLMQKKGWHTAYIRLPLAAGLATERLSIHMGQRMRWARGMIQILRQENTPMARELTIAQRLCYTTAGFSFLFALPRIVFLTSPLAFLFLGQNIIAASPLAIIAYAGSHMIHAFGTAARLNGRNRHSFWSEIYEATLAGPLVRVTLATLWDPLKGKFNVTDKGGMVEEGYLDVRAVLPTLVILGMLLIGVSIGIYGLATTATGSLEFQAYALNTLWAVLCLVPVSAAVAVGVEREQMRARARIQADIPSEIVLPDGRRMKATTSDLSLSGARLLLDRPLGVADEAEIRIAFHVGGEVQEVPAQLLRWEDDEAMVRFVLTDVRDEMALVRVFFGRPDAWIAWDHWPVDRPLRALRDVVAATRDAVFVRYRFRIRKAPVRKAAATAATVLERKSDMLRPRRAGIQAEDTPGTAARKLPELVSAVLLAVALGLPGVALAQAPRSLLDPGTFMAPPLSEPLPPPASVVPTQMPVQAPAPTTAPSVAPAPLAAAPLASNAVRELRFTLRELGLTGPMQFRGTADLQGVLFGFSRDEVVTAARLVVQGGSSAQLIPSLSQIAVTLNEQFVGNLPLDPARGAFGPVGFDLDPLAFAELNRLNFRFSARYTTECNDPLSGLLSANVSDLSTLSLTIERLVPQRDLARLPEPLFDRRNLRQALNLPVVMASESGTAALRAAAIATSYFAVEADYRGARFPVSRQLPPTGNALVFAASADAIPNLPLPRISGPTLALVPNPTDPFGTLLVIAGRSEGELVQAATAMAVGGNSFGGEAVVISAPPTLAPRQPYDAPRWVAADRAEEFGRRTDRTDLQAFGYSPGTIRVPLRTAPDLLTWAGRGIPVDIAFRAPTGQALDVAASRLDVAVSGAFLKSLPLGSGDRWWLPGFAQPWLVGTLLDDPAVRRGRVLVPTYLLAGQDELQMRFDMRPLARGDCVAVPGEIRAAIEPTSTIDITGAWRHARLPSLGFFASSGFPFTRMADLSSTALVLPEQPNTVETGAFLDLVGALALKVGLPATGLQVAFPNGLSAMANRDLILLGTLGRQPAATALLRDSPVQVTAERLTLGASDRLSEIRALFLGEGEERQRAAAALTELGESVAVIVGTQSPLQSGRSVVAVLGATPLALANAVATLRDPATAGQVQGDLSVLNGSRISAFRTGRGYAVGDPPWWLVPYLWIDEDPYAVIALMLAAALLLGLPTAWMLRRRSAMRLRARTPKDH